METSNIGSFNGKTIKKQTTMKQNLINTLLKLYAGLSFSLFACTPEENIHALMVFLPLAILNFALASWTCKKWLKVDWKKLDSMDFNIQ